MKTATIKDLLTESELKDLKDIPHNKEIQFLTVYQLREIGNIINDSIQLCPSVLEVLENRAKEKQLNIFY